MNLHRLLPTALTRRLLQRFLLALATTSVYFSTADALCSLVGVMYLDEDPVLAAPVDHTPSTGCVGTTGAARAAVRD